MSAKNWTTFGETNNQTNNTTSTNNNSNNVNNSNNNFGWNSDLSNWLNNNNRLNRSRYRNRNFNRNSNVNPRLNPFLSLLGITKTPLARPPDFILKNRQILLINDSKFVSPHIGKYLLTTFRIAGFEVRTCDKIPLPPNDWIINKNINNNKNNNNKSSTNKTNENETKTNKNNNNNSNKSNNKSQKKQNKGKNKNKKHKKRNKSKKTNNTKNCKNNLNNLRNNKNNKSKNDYPINCIVIPSQINESIWNSISNASKNSLSLFVSNGGVLISFHFRGVEIINGICDTKWQETSVRLGQSFLPTLNANLYSTYNRMDTGLLLKHKSKSLDNTNLKKKKVKLKKGEHSTFTTSEEESLDISQSSDHSSSINFLNQPLPPTVEENINDENNNNNNNKDDKEKDESNEESNDDNKEEEDELIKQIILHEKELKKNMSFKSRSSDVYPPITTRAPKSLSSLNDVRGLIGVKPKNICYKTRDDFVTVALVSSNKGYCVFMGHDFSEILIKDWNKVLFLIMKKQFVIHNNEDNYGPLKLDVNIEAFKNLNLDTKMNNNKENKEKKNNKDNKDSSNNTKHLTDDFEVDFESFDNTNSNENTNNEKNNNEIINKNNTQNNNNKILNNKSKINENEFKEKEDKEDNVTIFDDFGELNSFCGDEIKDTNKKEVSINQNNKKEKEKDKNETMIDID